MKKTIIIDGKELHLILGKTKSSLQTDKHYADNYWDFLFEELLNGAVEFNEDIWYYYIDGRCYETDIYIE